MLNSIRGLGSFLVESTMGAGFTIHLLFRSAFQVGALFRRHHLDSILRQMFVCGIQTIPATLAAAVTELQFKGLRPKASGYQLIAQAYAHDRLADYQLSDRRHNIIQQLGIARTQEIAATVA